MIFLLQVLRRALNRDHHSGKTGHVYDPIYADAVTANNIQNHTIFRSQNGLLTLISVAPFWAVALKLARYTEKDPSDICLILRCVAGLISPISLHSDRTW